jgi:hypothetical protein
LPVCSHSQTVYGLVFRVDASASATAPLDGVPQDDVVNQLELYDVMHHVCSCMTWLTLVQISRVLCVHWQRQCMRPQGLALAHMAARGGLILMEGVDRCGKSTQCSLLLSFLSMSMSAECVRFPGARTPLLWLMLVAYGFVAWSRSLHNHWTDDQRVPAAEHRA